MCEIKEYQTKQEREICPITFLVFVSSPVFHVYKQWKTRYPCSDIRLRDSRGSSLDHHLRRPSNK